MFNCCWCLMLNSFFQGRVFLYFTKLVVAILFLMDTVLISKQHLQPWIEYLQCIWQIFLFKAYCNFKWAPAAIHVSGTVIIQDAMCINLVFSRVLSFFEISTWNSPPVAAIHSTNGPFSIIERAVAATHSFKFTVIFQNRRSCTKDTS